MTGCRAAALAGLVLALGACSGRDLAAEQAAAQQAYQRGFAAMDAGDWVQAEQELTEAHRTFPEDPYILLDLGVVAQRQGRFAEARGYYQQVADRAPQAIPIQVSDPKAAGKTLADLARADLASLPPN